MGFRGVGFRLVTLGQQFLPVSSLRANWLKLHVRQINTRILEVLVTIRKQKHFFPDVEFKLDLNSSWLIRENPLQDAVTSIVIKRIWYWKARMLAAKQELYLLMLFCMSVCGYTRLQSESHSNKYLFLLGNPLIESHQYRRPLWVM